LAIIIQPYLPEHESAVKDFNQRLLAGGAGADLVFYEHAEPPWLPGLGGHPTLFNQFFLALDHGIVRGGYALKYQDFEFQGGKPREIAYYHHPISEGILNKTYAAVGGLLLRDAMRRAPLLYCLGMGGYDRPLPKMLMRLGWGHFPVPFYFRVVHAARFVREMQALRSSAMRRFIMDLAAYSGAAWAVTASFHLFRRLRIPRSALCDVETVEEFGSWADRLWQEARMAYTMSAIRDAQTLRTLYPKTDNHFTRLRISRNGAAIGWAVVAERRKNAKYGSLRVGSILDCWAYPDNTIPVILAATRALHQAGVDLIVSNQSHKAWGAALETAGFIRSESNFIFAASKSLTELLRPLKETKSQVHIVRADGDGLPRNF
jgi:hypothetical protein